MKIKFYAVVVRRFLAVLICLGLGEGFAQETLITETRTEFTAAADFDADGVLDAVVVDKETGQYQLGFSKTTSTTTWEGARSSGLTDLTGFSTGILLNREPGTALNSAVGTNRADLVFANPQANRINVFNATPGLPNPQPLAAFPVGIGPSLVVAVDIGGAGNSTNHDLLATSIHNNGPLTNWAGLLRNANDSFSATALGPVALPAPLSRGNRVTPRTNSGPSFVTLMSRQTGATQLQLFDLSAGNLLFKAAINPLPDAAEYTAGFFSNRAWLIFLTYLPGTTNDLAVYPLSEPAPGNFNFPAAPTLRFGFTTNVVEQVHVIRSSTKTGQIVVLLNGGGEARVLDFDGLNAPVPVETLNAPAGTPFTSVIGTGPGGFHLLSGTGGHSRNFQTHRWNGSNFGLVEAGELPALRRPSAGASLAQFRGEPFVVPQPVLLGLARVSDWASSPLFQNVGVGASAVRVVHAIGEAFRDSQLGLGTPSTVDVPALPGAAFALPSQYREAIGIATLTPAQGAIVSELSVSPASGTFAAGVCPVLFTSNASDVIQYRLNGGPWTRYTSPPALYESTVLEAYAEPSAGVLGGPRSALLTARYRITSPWEKVDSDEDGVPDFVEVANGLSPKGGSDSDHDGYSDLDELLAGTDPNRSSSVPSTNHIENTLSFPAHISVAPEPHLIPLPGFGVLEGTRIGLRQLSGALVAEAPATRDPLTPPLITAAAAEFVLQLTSGSLLTVATPENFEVSPSRPLAGEPSGRELLAIIPAPATILGQVPYRPTAQSELVQANAWLRSARDYLATNPPPRLASRLQPVDVLNAALFEHKVDSLLPTNVWHRAVPLTFFPHRPQDAGRTNVPARVLQSLMAPARSNTWNLRSVLLQIGDLTRVLTNQPTLDLRLVTAELYRVGTYSNLATVTNIVGGVTNVSKLSTYGALLDELRLLIETGTVSSNYAALPSLPPTLIAGAAQGAQELLSAVQPRPRSEMELVVRAASFHGELAGVDCAVLETPGGNRVALYDRYHRRFALNSSFDSLLIPGSRVRVTGFSDLPVPECADLGLEVVTMTLLDVPAPALTDLDADGLADEWERTFFGDIAIASGSGDFDGDGVSNRDEFIAGTDPTNAASHRTPSTPEDLAAGGVPTARFGGAEATEMDSGDLAVVTDGSAEAGVELDAGSAEGMQVGVVETGTNPPVILSRSAIRAAGLPPRRLTLTVLGTQADLVKRPLLAVRLDRGDSDLLVTPDSTAQGASSNTFLLIGAHARLLGEVRLAQGAGLRLRDQIPVPPAGAGAAVNRAHAVPAGAGETAVRFAVNFGSALAAGFNKFTGNLAVAVLEGAAETIKGSDSSAPEDGCDDSNECGGDPDEGADGGNDGGGDSGNTSSGSTATRIVDLPGGSISNVVTIVIVPTDATVGANAISQMRLTTPDVSSFRVRNAGVIFDGLVYGASGGARVTGSTGPGDAFTLSTRPPLTGSLAARRTAGNDGISRLSQGKAVGHGAARVQAGLGEDIPSFRAGLTHQRGFGITAALEQFEERLTGSVVGRWDGADLDAVLESKVPDLMFNPKELGVESVVYRLDGNTRSLPFSAQLALNAKGGGEVSMEELSLNFDTRQVLIVALDGDGIESGRHVVHGDQLGRFRGQSSLTRLHAPIPLAGHPVSALERILHFDGPIAFQPAGGAAASTGQVFIVRSELTRTLVFPSRPTAGFAYPTALTRTNRFQSAKAQDWGDAPHPGFPTLEGRNGARHTLVRGLRLGRKIDAEPNGLPHPFALGDDVLGLDDEDGVSLRTALDPGVPATVAVQVRATTGTARLDAFVDFNANGNWTDAGEKIFNSKTVTNGLNLLSFVVPSTARRTNTFARFRLSRTGGLGPDGPAPDGEVEDYRVRIGVPRNLPRIGKLTLGDDGRPLVLVAPGGDGIVTLEATSDLTRPRWEAEGQPTPPSEGVTEVEGLPRAATRRFFRLKTE